MRIAGAKQFIGVSKSGSNLRAAVLLVIFAASAHAQTFEVASIKPASPKSERGWEGGPGSSDPTRFRYNAATLKDLIVKAWNIEYFQVTGPAGIEKQVFDFVANVPAGITKPAFRVLLQNFLAERFALRVHIETKAFAAYELVIAKGGTKLKEAVPGEPAPKSPEGFPDLQPGKPGMVASNRSSGKFILVRLNAQQEPMSVLAQILHPPNEAQVVDRTGLPGRYNFTLEYTQDLPGAASDSASEPPVAPSIFTALQQQLGLQLIPKQIPFDVVIVDSFKPTPSEN